MPNPSGSVNKLDQNKTECGYIKKNKKISTTFALLLIAALLIANPLAVSAHDVGAYDIVITKDYVKATGKCTCSLQADYAYHTATFKNYCPNCHSKGTLNYEQGSGYHNPEGMWYCTRCDMDFCLVHGKEHVSGTDNYLKRMKNQATKKTTHNSQKVNAQTNTEEYIQIIVNDKTYLIKKSAIKKIRNNNFWWTI